MTTVLKVEKRDASFVYKFRKTNLEQVLLELTLLVNEDCIQIYPSSYGVVDDYERRGGHACDLFHKIYYGLDSEIAWFNRENIEAVYDACARDIVGMLCKDL